MSRVTDVADWFLINVENVTNKKLQKLVYYAYAWYLAFNNESVEELNNRFFENKFEAWVHGCVYPSLYEKFKNNGSDVIPKPSETNFAFSADDLDLLNQIKAVYGKYNGNELEYICHSEAPWINARGNIPAFEPCHTLIKDEDIFTCYAARLR